MNTLVPNPFNPQFGKRPKQFIGRELIINNFLQSLGDINDPHRTTVVTGIRGFGKTAVLSDIHASLDPKEYMVIDITAHDGMLLEILDEFIRGSKGKKWLSSAFEKMQGFSVGALGFSFGVTKSDNSDSHSFRFMVSEMLDELKQKSIKTVFLIDEVHNDTPEMREFAITYQHLVREEYDVSLFMAGLPSSVNDVLNDKVLTFLRRAHRVELESINNKAVEIAFFEAFDQGGRKFIGDSLTAAAKATMGYPYLIQLLGYFLYKGNKEEIDERFVEQSLTLAKIELFKNVHDMLLQALSVKDRDFLFAMTSGEEPVSFSDVRAQLGVTPGYASKYRERLMVAGIIKSAGHGKLGFAPPYMGEYLREKMFE